MDQISTVGTRGRPVPHADSTPSLGHLNQEASRLLHNSLAPNTHQSYYNAIQQFQNFRVLYSLAHTWPVSVDQLLQYIAYLSLGNRSYRTVCLYVSALSHLHKINSWQDNSKVFSVAKTLEGLRRSNGINPDLRIPISYQLFLQIIQALPSVCRSGFESNLFKAAYTLTYFGLLRISEALGLCFADLHRNSEGNFLLTLHRSKTNQVGNPIQVLIHKQIFPSFCPVSSLIPYLNSRPKNAVPLLVHADGKPITQFQFQAILQRTLNFLQVPGHFRSHSFRIGMATELARRGFSHNYIKQKGRWKSNSYLSYIRT